MLSPPSRTGMNPKLNFVISSTKQTAMEQGLRRQQFLPPVPNQNIMTPPPPYILFSLCRAERWAEFTKMTQTNPSFSLWIGPYGQNLLHFVCQRRPTVEAVNILLRSCPEAVKKTDADECIPLHMAMTNGASHHVLSLLISAAPETVVHPNKWGYCAFEWIWERCRIELSSLLPSLLYRAGTKNNGMIVNDNCGGIGIPTNVATKLKSERQKVWRTVELLIVAKHGTTVEFSPNDSLLHMISNIKNCPISLVQAIANEFPEMSLKRDGRGRVPLAAAAASHLVTSPRIIDILIEANRDMIMVPDNDGRLAIHLAINSCKDWHNFGRHLVTFSPDCIRSPDPITALQPFMMIASKEKYYSLMDVNDALRLCVDIFNQSY